MSRLDVSASSVVEDFFFFPVTQLFFGESGHKPASWGMWRWKLEPGSEDECVCVCVLGVWGGDTQRKAPWLCSRRSSELLRSPAASCCVFVSAKTSKPITNVVHYTRVSVCVCVSGCVSRCAAVKIIQPSWEASWELHTPLFVCSVCLPRHKSSAAVLFFFGVGLSLPPQTVSLSSLCYLLLFVLLSVFVGGLDSPLRISCVW